MPGLASHVPHLLAPLACSARQLPAALLRGHGGAGPSGARRLPGDAAAGGARHRGGAPGGGGRGRGRGEGGG
jgi:hypothetical protein